MMSKITITIDSDGEVSKKKSLDFEQPVMATKTKPTFYLNSEDLSELGDVEVGDKIRLQMGVEVKRISKEAGYKTYDFQVAYSQVKNGITKKGNNQISRKRVVK